MKVVFFICVLLVLLQSSIQYTSLKSGKNESDKVSSGLDMCKACISFAEQFINQLLNIILNAGVVGGCADVCGMLQNKTGSNIAGVVCNLLCDYVGITEFIKVIEEADLDPIYYCELLKACEIKDDGDASITMLGVLPSPVQKGTNFEINLTFKTKNGTGTGEISLQIGTQDGMPLGDSELYEPQNPGTYNVTWKVDAKPDPSCDPSQGPCEMWIPGNYSVNVAICNGQCGSKHPHSKVYDMKKVDFNVVAGKGY